MGFLTRGIQNVARNATRTLAIVIILGLSIGLSLIMLLSLKSVQAKISNIKSSVGNTITVSPAGVRGFEGGGEPLTQAQVDKAKSVQHVTAVLGTLSDRLTSENSNLVSAIDAGSLGRRNANNSGQTFAPPSGGISGQGSSSGATRSFTPPVTVSGTDNPADLSSTTGGGTFKLTSGEVFKSQSTDLVAVVGKSIAEKNNLTVGSTFKAYNSQIKVVGIFDSGNTFANNQVVMPLATVQKLSDQAGQLNSATVKVDSISNIDSATTAVKQALGDSVDITNSSEQAKTTIEPLENIKKIATYGLLGSIVAGGVIILLTMTMIVRERRKEIGVLKAIGASNIKIVIQFVSEAITLTFLGGLVGLALGATFSNQILQVMVNSSSQSSSVGQGGPGRGMMRLVTGGQSALANLSTSIGTEILLYGLAAVVIIAIIGSAVPAWFISKVRPAEVMRSE